MQNEPNSRRRRAGRDLQGRGTRGDCAKRTQFRPSAREWARAAGAGEVEVCKTNPISARLGQGQVSSGRKMQNEPNSVGSNAQNEANLGQPGWHARANRAKRTQFRRAGRDGACGAEGDCAKQTQFGATRLAFGERLCKTHLISPERPGMGAGGRGREALPGPTAQNEPNFVELASGCNTHHSTVLSFHHPSPMPIVRNEANLSIADLGLRIGASLRWDACRPTCRFRPAPAGCTNKPNWAEPIVQNEANSAASTSAMTERLTVSSYLRGSCLYWIATGNRRTAMERSRL